MHSLENPRPDYSHIVGVFRDESQAIQAVDELKQTGMGENRIQMAEYNPSTTGSPMPTPAEREEFSTHDSNRRILVHVLAAGREHEVVDILAHNGANNADIPLGTELVNGSLVRSHTRTGA